MFEPVNLDAREQEIWETADSFWAMRFNGAGSYERLGPYDSQVETIAQVQAFFKQEDAGTIGPPPDAVWSRPFLIYASSSKANQAQISVGLVFRDGVKRDTYAEFREKRKEQQALVAKQRRRGNRARSN